MEFFSFFWKTYFAEKVSWINNKKYQYQLPQTKSVADNIVLTFGYDEPLTSNQKLAFAAVFFGDLG
jgi:hypothetical protein